MELLEVRKPARYIGEEYNIIKKDWDKSRIKVCLCYPDLYEIGMSHLGLKILYHILNRGRDTLCERCFTPWLDMEEMMLKEKTQLFSLENKKPLAEFDIVGFSLQHELTYTNLLNMLYLSGIPLRSAERRGETFPLIIAGGACAFNPEPLADFIDLFLIGDGEEAIIDIIETYKRFGPSREEILREMAKIDGAYVPSFYDIPYTNDKQEAIKPVCEGIPEKIKKRTIKSLKKEDFPTKPVVPYISIIHDRITLEIMRGCPNNCSFCQAKSVYGPVRIRSQEDILDLAKEAYKNTGFDEISLLSLSSSCYPAIDKLLDKLTEVFAPLGVGLSLPSLRIEDQLDKMPSLISVIKRSGFTFAPEVGSERMLQVINKGIKHEKLFETLEQVYKKGWRRVKLYFMIGLPFEQEEDLEAIIGLADRAALLRKEFFRHPAEVAISVSSFIPKPHTPFQRMEMQAADKLREKQEFLAKRIAGKRYLKLKLHDLNASIVEGVFSRGDRRLGSLLLSAWKKGARFDAWSESFKPQLWEEAFIETGLSKEPYLCGRRPEEALPWQHIECQ